MDYIQWILDGRVDKLYNSRPWRNLRLKALERDHHECQMCKKNPKVNKIVFANTVHHIKEVKDRPDLAMDLDNLISLCRGCHEEIHERLDKANEKRKKVSKFTNEERW
ncbi:HNH endonuclease [Turicibacter sanguinis]|uniref:HNH endonuclease n=1 Tax=Turicibacter sanguinis TaxID=154288 RepID=UPI0006BF9C16|nr:HNH endonuclease signature motif containing protein [Turicibacter sanguinis]CUN04371.1 HNH endonuclease [Turicibacter sanguinis]